MFVSVALFLLLLYLIMRRSLYRQPGLPPGEMGIPILGITPFAGRDVYSYIEKLRRTYGDIYCIKLGHHLAVVLSDYSTIKSVFNNPDVQGRADFFSFNIFSGHNNRGTVFAQGPMHLQARRHTMRFLKDFGMGKSLAEDIIHYEINALLKELEKSVDKPTDLSSIFCFNVAVLNVIWKMVAVEDVMYNMDNMFIGGMETLSSTMRWCLLYMAKEPEVQRRVQQEIDQALPRDKLPTLQDRDSLMYCEAVIHEVHRKASFFPLSLPHRNTKDIQVNGYTIPKNTVIMINTKHCHWSPKYWSHPEKFYPEHFLDDQGRIITKKDGFMPFGIGRRQCLGEILARSELFLFFVGIMQKFTISPAPGETPTECCDPTSLFVRIPVPFKFILKVRGPDREP